MPKCTTKKRQLNMNAYDLFDSPKPSQSMPSNGLIAVALSCLDSCDYFDLTIKCNERGFKVHKMVLCPQSSFFAKAVKNDAFQEGQTGVIYMDQDDPDAIHAMLRFLYTGDYNKETLTMQGHLKVYELADKVDISALKTLSEDKFKALAQDEWKDATFLACVEIVYEIAPPGTAGDNLRSATVQIASQHAWALFNLGTGFKQMTMEVAEFGADMLEMLAQSAEDPMLQDFGKF